MIVSLDFFLTTELDTGRHITSGDRMTPDVAIPAEPLKASYLLR
jgi:hypothetical protein